MSGWFQLFKVIIDTFVLFTHTFKISLRNIYICLQVSHHQYYDHLYH